MAKITIARTDINTPDESALETVRRFLFGVVDGATKEDKRAWRRFWATLIKLEPGEMATAEMRFPRSGPFHRLHMAMEQAVFDAQERFEHFETMRSWLKVGAGFVEWHPGPKGGIAPIPRSIAYTSLDDEEFRKVHEDMIQFLLTPHAQKTLWPHLQEDQRAEMMHSVLDGFL